MYHNTPSIELVHDGEDSNSDIVFPNAMSFRRLVLNLPKKQGEGYYLLLLMQPQLSSLITFLLFCDPKLEPSQSL